MLGVTYIYRKKYLVNSIFVNVKVFYLHPLRSFYYMVSILQKLCLSTPKVDAAQTDRCVFVKTSHGQGEWSTNKGVGEVGKNVLEGDGVV